ncbi:MAG: hypothetical protein ACI815_001686 [Psychroserpens sp.]
MGTAKNMKMGNLGIVMYYPNKGDTRIVDVTG